MLGLDSQGRITNHAAQAAAALGVKVWGRYLYNLIPDEIAEAHAAGIGILLFGEHDTLSHHPIHDGYYTGLQHGRADRAVAVALGAPFSAAIYATGDDKIFDGNDEIMMDKYLDGYRDGLGGGFAEGLYAGAGPIQFALQGGHTQTGLCAGASYWDNGVDPRASGASAHQLAAAAVNVGGTQCDTWDIYDLDGLRAWMPSTYQPTAPPQQSGELSMADVQTILDAIAELKLGELTLAVNEVNALGPKIDALAAQIAQLAAATVPPPPSADPVPVEAAPAPPPAPPAA